MLLNIAKSQLSSDDLNTFSVTYAPLFVKYLDAFAALRIAEEKFMCVSKSRILLVKLELLHECALHRYTMNQWYLYYFYSKKPHSVSSQFHCFFIPPGDI